MAELEEELKKATSQKICMVMFVPSLVVRSTMELNGMSEA